MGKDTIADIITSIRNADMNRKGTVRIASTNITENVGFIENARKLVENKNKKEFLVLTLRHRRNRKGPYRPILNLKRISRPGLRIYFNYRRIPRILDGMGIANLSLLLGDRAARLEESVEKFCVIYGGCDPLLYIYSRWLEAKLKEVVMI
ncbi:hypothetical protein CUMW_158090 [Citrus unshiu]|uniref:30S ribosomal protein S8, chloroplastic n=1 Tax=Citrus unshiu TaxID=55188 RepID=A0A2H5PQJ0_CITUN|nr:hypothetical protein CUMW_158090 [Citrus unshiu]